MKNAYRKETNLPPSKRIRFFSKYEIFEDGTVINSRTRRVIACSANQNRSLSLTNDRGHYTTKTLKSIMKESWGGE